MKRLVLLAALTVAVAAGAAWRQAAFRRGELLPGRSRPLLEHSWAHPRDLKFGGSPLRPPDPGAALFMTPAGLRAFILTADGDPLVQITAAIPLGVMRETEGERGATELIGRLLQRDLDGRLGRAFVGRLQIDQEPDVMRVSLQVPSEDWKPSIAALIGTVRTLALDEPTITAFRTGPGYVRPTRNLGGSGFRPAVELARLCAAPPGAPPPPDRPLERETVAAIAARGLRPEAVVMGIGGGVARAEVEAVLTDLTAGWLGKSAAAPALTGPGGTSCRERFQALDEPGFTSWMAIGHAVDAIPAAEEAAVALMVEVLNIRLNIAVREIRGLANQAVLHVTAGPYHPGLLHVRTGARAESIAPLVRYIKEELARIREPEGAPGTEELEQAKGGLALGAWHRAIDGVRAASGTFAVETARHGSTDRFLGWPERVRAVGSDQVRAAAARYIRPDDLATVIIGQLDAIRVARHPRWPATLPELSSASSSGR